MSKGSKRRKCQIPTEQFARRWEEVFAVEQAIVEKKVENKVDVEKRYGLPPGSLSIPKEKPMHSQEPWTCGDIVADANGEIIFDRGWYEGEQTYPSEEDWERIVACVNACRGFSTEELVVHNRTLADFIRPLDTPHAP
jgi:hypothetical protein